MRGRERARHLRRSSPKDVGPPKAAGGGIGVLGLVGVPVVDAVVRAPVERLFSKAPARRGRKTGAGPRRFVAAVAEQAVVAHGDAQPTGKVPDDEENGSTHVTPNCVACHHNPAMEAMGVSTRKRVFTTLMLSFPLPAMVWWRTP